MTKLSTAPYKGTRDFYPPEMRIRTYLFDTIRGALKNFGYEEYDGPMLESFELYASKTSEEIVNQQLYWLVDRGERKMAIRPEMTPTLARMVAGKQNELPKPIRWFSIPNLWRYERPQRGRLREHWQLNVDTFGGEPGLEDLEICQVIVAIMNAFGAKAGFEVKLNHRGLTDHLFKSVLKLSEEQIPVVGRLLDGAPKMKPGEFEELLAKDASLDAKQISFLKGLFEKDASEKLKATFNGVAAYTHMQELFEKLKALGIEKHFRYDPSIMRGFLYYTGMVLEVYDTHPDNNRALFGGGRYDNLVGMFGGNPLSGVGFGMGDVTLQNFLVTHGLLPNLEKPNGLFLAHMNSENSEDACFTQKLAQEFRNSFQNQGRAERVLTSLSAEKPKKIFPMAEKLGARAAIIVGSNEIKTGRLLMKDLVTGEQYDGDVASLVEKFLKLK